MFPGDYKISNRKYSERLKKAHHINKDPQDKKPIKYRNELKDESAKKKKGHLTKEASNKLPKGLNLYF